VWPLVFVAAFVAYLFGFYLPTSVPSVSHDGTPFTRLDVAIGLFALLPDIPGKWHGGDPSSIGVLDRVPIVLMAAALLGIAYVCGRLLLELIGATRGLSRLESSVFSIAVGLNAVSLWTLAVGLSIGLGSVLAFAVPAVIVLATAGYRWKAWRFALAGSKSDRTDNASEQRGRSRGSSGWLGSGWLWLAAPFVVVILLGAILPPMEFDVREYHLQVPKEWYQAGRIEFLPHNVYGNMPLGAQILGIPAMAAFGGDLDWWWGSLVGKTLLGVFGPLTALALYAAGRRFFSATAGGIAAVVYVSIPWVLLVSTSGFVDGAWAFYVFVACYAALIAAPVARKNKSNRPLRGGQELDAAAPPAELEGARTEADSPGAASGTALSWPHLLLAGFLAGAAVACKYPSLAFVVLPLFGWLLLVCPRAKWKIATVFLLAVVAGCGLWLGKNWVLAGNPVYPLAGQLLGGKTRTAEKIAQWERAHQVPLSEKGERWSLPQAGDAIARIGWRSQWLSPLLMPFAVLAFFVGRSRRLVLWFAAMAVWMFVVWWAVTHRIDRFLLPLFPMLALLAGVGATWSHSRWWRHGLLAILFWVCVVHFLLVHAMVDSRFLVALDRLRKDPARVNPVHRHLNLAVPTDGRVLLVGDAQPFDLEVPHLYNTCFDDCWFERFMKGRTAEQRREALARYRITHVYVRWNELERYRSKGNYGYSDYVTEEVVDDLIGEGILGRPVGHFKGRFVELYPVEGGVRGKSIANPEDRSRN
jgi:4-amino-4-deoxy-L-arabinose transferase-like glycosyltransferase